jgi:hypothetical protein
MSSRKRARRSEGKVEKATFSNGKPLYDSADKDSEEENLENILFGAQTSHKYLRHSEDEALTGLEHVPDSEVRLVLCEIKFSDVSFLVAVLLRHWQWFIRR